MKKITRLSWLFLACLLVGQIFLPYSTHAQSIGVKISPVRVEEIVDPGETLNLQLKVSNESAEKHIFYAYLRDFRAEQESENGEPYLIAPGSEDGYFLASWINITQEGINFGPNEEKIVPFQIKVPANAGPGGYYGAILFGPEPPKLMQGSEDKGAGMAVSGQTASLILLQVKGDVYEDARIREFTTDKQIYSSPFQVNFATRIENIGNIHVKPVGTITIKNFLGKEVATVSVNDRGSNILPHSIRRFDASFDGKIGFGRYQAVLGMTYGTKTSLGGQGKQTLFSEIAFWVIPWKIVIPAVLGTILLIVLIVLFLRFYRGKAVGRAMEQMGMGHARYVRGYQGPSPILHFALILGILLVIIFVISILSYFIFFA